MKAGASGSVETGVGKDFLILTWKGNFGVGWTASQTPALCSIPERLGRSKQSGWGVQFCRLHCFVNLAFPPGSVMVVCLKLVLVWPVGKSELQSLGFTLSLCISGSEARSLVYFKSGETWAQDRPVTKPPSSWSELARNPKLSQKPSPGSDLPCPK